MFFVSGGRFLFMIFCIGILVEFIVGEFCFGLSFLNFLLDLFWHYFFGERVWDMFRAFVPSAIQEKHFKLHQPGKT